MKKIIAAAAIAFSLLAPLTAHADTVPGWYVSGGVIAHQPIDSTASRGGVNNKLEYDLGWGVEGALGYAWASGIRTEGELAFSRATASKVNGAQVNTGHLNNLDVMANLYYDFQTHTSWTPYVGVGIGMGNVDIEHVGPITGGGLVNDSSDEFAYQGIAGIAYQFNNFWSFQADYRYVGTTDPTMKVTVGTPVSMDNASHNIVLSFRYTMHPPAAPPPVELEQAAPPPMPQPMPAPAPVVAAVPQSYMVFFDFDKYDLTPEAQRILSAAAQDYQRHGYVRVVVTGHTDTVGTSQYNQKLSERRSNAVKNYLVKLGVDPHAIMAMGVGKNGLLVPTANGVREAQNRRAEIVLGRQ